jgi:hypothetical protein
MPRVLDGRACASNWIVTLALVAALLVAGCGGDDDGGGRGTGLEGAENTVKDYLRALVDGDGGAACDLLTDGYRTEIVERNKTLADRLGASDCEELVSKLVKRSRRVTFEREPLTKDSIEGIDLKTELRAGDPSDAGDDAATVTGPKRAQAYELEVTGGEWRISRIR